MTPGEQDRARGSEAGSFPQSIQKGAARVPLAFGCALGWRL